MKPSSLPAALPCPALPPPSMSAPRVGRFTLPVISKLFLAVVVSEGLVLLLTSIGVLIDYATSSQKDDHENQEETEVVGYSSLAICTVLFLVYFAADGVRKENPFQLWAFVFSSLLVTAYVVYRHACDSNKRDGCTYLGDFYNSVSLALVLIVGVFDVIYFVIGYLVNRAFGWYVYRSVGPSEEMASMFRIHQVFVSLIKVDLLMAVLLLNLAAFFLGLAAWEIALDCVVIGVTCVWAVMGVVGAKYEVRSYMILYFLFALCEPVYILQKFGKLATRSKYHHVDTAQFYFVGSLAVLIRIALLAMAWMAWRTFGRGMREQVFGLQEAQSFFDPFVQTIRDTHAAKPPPHPTVPQPPSSAGLSTTYTPPTYTETTRGGDCEIQAYSQ